MKIYVIFGLPGAGKTFVGEIMQKYFDFYLYEGDQDMSEDYKNAIRNEKVTDELRKEFFDKLIASIGKLNHTKIVVTQTFIKEKFREQFLNAFPDAKFILVESSTTTRENRLMNRDAFELPIEKWRNMAKIFEKPKIKHVVITNNQSEEEVKQQVYVILERTK